MGQEILVYIIISVAVGITLFKAYQAVFKKKNAIASSCSSCSSSACGSCSLNAKSNNSPAFPVRVLHDEIKVEQ
jgi:succinate dehydrogenase/fumarate reductase-like Fe-S protein